jgi:hypothetical protein
MDTIPEEITLVSGMAQNQDGQVLNEKKLHHTTDNIQHQTDKHFVLIR